MILAAALALSLHAGAAGLGGHERPSAEAGAAADAETARQAALDQMWRRRILPPDQGMYAPEDLVLLQRMSRVDADAVEYLRRKPGGLKPWTVAMQAGAGVRVVLTKEGFERYRALATQDAIAWFEGRGADAKWVLRFTDLDGKKLFDGSGRITEAGETVWTRAKLNLEVFWRAPNGEVSGTRKPPAGGFPPPNK